MADDESVQAMIANDTIDFFTTEIPHFEIVTFYREIRYFKKMS
jgi:hypothetical protein